MITSLPLLQSMISCGRYQVSGLTSTFWIACWFYGEILKRTNHDQQRWSYQGFSGTSTICFLNANSNTYAVCKADAEDHELNKLTAEINLLKVSWTRQFRFFPLTKDCILNINPYLFNSGMRKLSELLDLSHETEFETQMSPIQYVVFTLMKRVQ